MFRKNDTEQSKTGNDYHRTKHALVVGLADRKKLFLFRKNDTEQGKTGNDYHRTKHALAVGPADFT